MEVVLIATPTRNSGNIKSLREAIIRRGWTLKEIEAKDLSLEVISSGLRVLYQGNEFNPQAVIYRMVGRYLTALAPIFDHWISLGVCVINSPKASMTAWNKVQSSVVLAKAGVPILNTTFAYPHKFETELEEETPYVVKPIFGAQGNNIRFFDTKKQTESFIESTYFYSEGLLVVPPLMIQKDLGIDVTEIRAQVIGGKCVALMRRTPPNGERFSDNLAGGTNENLPLSHPAVLIAENAAKALDLDFTGIDLFETKDGCLVSEANGSPGWVGLELVSGVSVSDALFDLIEERVTGSITKVDSTKTETNPKNAYTISNIQNSNEIVTRKQGWFRRLTGVKV